MKLFFYLLPIFAGIAITVQSGINSQLRAAIQHPLMAAFISFIVGTVALAIMLFFSKETFPELGQYSNVKWYQYSGGLLGAFVVTSTLIVVSRIGAANMFVLIIAGQLATAVIMDHFGVLGVKENPMNLQKLIGLVLVICGAYIVNRART
jgi:bacterial/archaeal transporter family-2 protein